MLFAGRFEIVARALQLAFGFPPLRFRLRELRFQIAALFAETLELVGAREDAGVFPGAAAGHRAAGVQNLSVQRHDAEAVIVPACNGDGVGERFRNGRAPEKARNDGAVAFIAVYKIGAHADVARLASRLTVQPRRTDHIHRLERYASAVAPFQEREYILAVILRINNNIADVRAERRFHGERVPVLGADHFADRPVHTAQRAALRLLHDDLRSLAEALQLLFQFRKEVDARIAGAQLHGELCLPFGGLRRLLLTPCHEHGVTGDHVGKALFFFLYLIQALLLFRETRRGFLVLPLRGGELFLCLHSALFHRLAVFRKKRDRRAALGERTGELTLMREHGGETLVLFVHAGGVFRLAAAKFLCAVGQRAPFGGDALDACAVLPDLTG